MSKPTITGERNPGDYVLKDGDFEFKVEGMRTGGIAECRRQLGLRRLQQGFQLTDVIEHICIKPERFYNPIDRWTVEELINNDDPRKRK